MGNHKAPTRRLACSAVNVDYTHGSASGSLTRGACCCMKAPLLDLLAGRLQQSMQQHA